MTMAIQINYKKNQKFGWQLEIEIFNKTMMSLMEGKLISLHNDNINVNILSILSNK